jgi:serine/threonine-protein kinase
VAADDRSRLAAALAGRFAIERELGRGGMATVWLAQDVKHDRLVALKVLRPEIAAALGVERFLREIHIAARLAHPHIVPLHDSGEVDGLLYYIMPYVEGESLRERMQREGPLPVDQAVRLAREIAGALVYAHAHGIVHRDIKPENVLLQSGHAVVTDFGIARAVTAAAGPALTRSGVIIGTPLYMSPEQVAGDPVDGRSDVYSLGCVLYEMLAGVPPYPGGSSLEVLARHTVDPVPSLRERRTDVPAAVAHAVARALAKMPSERQPDATAFEAELAALAPPAGGGPGRRARSRGIGAGLLAAAILTGGYLLLTERPRAPEKSIAVLPLANQSGSQEDLVRSDGMTEALIDALSHVSALRVASRISVAPYQDAKLDSRAIGQRLGVATLLEGSYERAGTVLQVSVRLVNAADGYVLWADTFRRDRKDVFAVQDQISQAVVRALQVRLAGDTRPLVAPQTENIEAYDLYLKGRWFWNQRVGGPAPLHRALGFFEQAIALDSNYARAWAGLADVYSMLPAFGDAAPGDAFPKARAAVERAIALDSTLADAHTSSGIISVFYDWDWPAAGREFARAIALDSTEPRAHLFHAWYFAAQGRLDDALAEVESARRLNPLSPIVNARLGSTLYYLGRYDSAVAVLRRAIEVDSTNASARAELGRVEVQLGRFDDAITAMPRDEDLQAGYLGNGALGYAYGHAGRRADALITLRRLEQRARVRYIDPEAFAMIAVGLGDTATALTWLERARDMHSFYVPFIAADPMFKPLQRSPRFLDLVRFIGLRFPGASPR